MSPAYAEWDFFPRAYLTLMSDPIGGRQIAHTIAAIPKIILLWFA